MRRDNPSNVSVRYLDKDQRDMRDGFDKDFEEIVNTEVGFMHEGDSYLVIGPNANWNCEVLAVCLFRGGYGVYRTSPTEILRRLSNETVMDSDDVLTNWSHEVECYVIADLFEQDTYDALTPNQIGTLTWFVSEAVRLGAVVVAPINVESAGTDDVDLNIYGEVFGRFVEDNFEAIHGKAKKNKR